MNIFIDSRNQPTHIMVSIFTTIQKDDPSDVAQAALLVHQPLVLQREIETYTGPPLEEISTGRVEIQGKICDQFWLPCRDAMNGEMAEGLIDSPGKVLSHIKRIAVDARIFSSGLHGEPPE